jgi:hypothetical protein
MFVIVTSLIFATAISIITLRCFPQLPFSVLIAIPAGDSFAPCTSTCASSGALSVQFETTSLKRRHETEFLD